MRTAEPGIVKHSDVVLAGYLAFLQDRAKYPPDHRFYPRDYESFMYVWLSDFYND